MTAVPLGWVTSLELDCGRFSRDNGAPECERRSNTGLGLVLVAGVVVVALMWVLWRRRIRKLDEGGSASASTVGDEFDQ